jgi:hypothetical protein
MQNKIIRFTKGFDNRKRNKLRFGWPQEINICQLSQISRYVQACINHKRGHYTSGEGRNKTKRKNIYQSFGIIQKATEMLNACQKIPEKLWAWHSCNVILTVF